MRRKTRGIRLGAWLLALLMPAFAQSEEVLLESDGWEIHGVWESAQTPAAAVLLLHQAAGDREDFSALAQTLHDTGLHTLRLELRGHGASTNLGRFEPPYSDTRHINDEAWRDIAIAIDWLRARQDVVVIAVVAASYSGEQAALALREGKRLADAYVMFSPGDFQDASIAAVDPSGVPWLFIRTEQESPASVRWIDEIYALLPEMATSAEIWVLPGYGHAATMLDGRDRLPAEVGVWLDLALRSARDVSND